MTLLCVTSYSDMQPTGYSQTIRSLFSTILSLVVLHIFATQAQQSRPFHLLSYSSALHCIQLYMMTAVLGDWSTITFRRPDITATRSANAQQYCHAYLAMVTTTQDTTVLVSSTILVLCHLPVHRKHMASTLSLSVHFRNRH